MEHIEYIVRKDLEPYVNSIMVSESEDPQKHTNIPLYADGYPGIMFQQSESGFYLLPRNKKLSELFLFGQTLEPVSLDVKGVYRFVVVQLYPFASKYLLGVDPKELNDECFDLLQLTYMNTKKYWTQLKNTTDVNVQIEIISDLMQELITLNKVPSDDRIQQSIYTILKNRGQITIKRLIEELHVTERTFERKFMSQVGLTPKQFAKIVQFQYSLNKLTRDNFENLTEIGFDSGFSDQSHFIREFKKYTGKTPSNYLELRSA